jgi:hypothetical protein
LLPPKAAVPPGLATPLGPPNRGLCGETPLSEADVSDGFKLLTSTVNKLASPTPADIRYRHSPVGSEVSGYLITNVDTLQARSVAISSTSPTVLFGGD